MAKYTYLQREEVLKYIDTLHFRTQYIKIIILDKNECPLRAIEGRATDGSINVNGSSAVRRTGSVNLVTELQENTDNPLEIMNEVTNIKTLISMNKRVEIEIGIENTGNQFLEEKIFWIPFGVFIIQNASVTYNNQGIVIQLKLTDKMALLNGELGGSFTTPIVHSPEGQYADGGQTIVEKGVKISTLIEYLVRDFGDLKEFEYAIEDIPDQIDNLIRWSDKEHKLCIRTNPETGEKTLIKVELDYFPFSEFEELLNFNEIIGYTKTDFVYPLDKKLDSKAGETVASVLDKIKNTLGNYEYFFDIDGIFRFREIQNFVNEGSAIEDLTHAIADKYFLNAGDSKSVYSFYDAALITSYSNNPQFNQIKNDYSVWGKNGNEKDIQYHLVLREAPGDYENQHWRITIGTKQKAVLEKKEDGSYENIVVDDFPYIEKAIPDSAAVNYNQFITKNIEEPNVIWINFDAGDRAGRSGSHVKDDDWRLKMYFIALSKEFKEQSAFDKEMIEKMPTLYWLDGSVLLFDQISLKNAFFQPIYDRNNLEYWFDIINTNDLSLMQATEISQFSIENIGRRTKVLNDDKVNCLFYSHNQEDAYRYEFIEDKENPESITFSPSIQDNMIIKIGTNVSLDGKNKFWGHDIALGVVENPAYDLLRSSIHEHLSYNNNINITTMPVYHLDVNQRITVNNKESNISGDYMINSLTIPLTLDGMMTINARKAIERM